MPPSGYISRGIDSIVERFIIVSSPYVSSKERQNVRVPYDPTTLRPQLNRHRTLGWVCCYCRPMQVVLDLSSRGHYCASQKLLGPLSDRDQGAF